MDYISQINSAENNFVYVIILGKTKSTVKVGSWSTVKPPSRRSDNRTLFCQNPQEVAFEEVLLEGHLNRILGFSDIWVLLVCATFLEPFTGHGTPRAGTPSSWPGPLRLRHVPPRTSWGKGGSKGSQLERGSQPMAFSDSGRLGVGAPSARGTPPELDIFQRKKKHININKFVGLSRDWVSAKKLLMCFFRVIPNGEKRHINKIPPQNPVKFLLMCFFLYVLFSLPNVFETPVTMTPQRKMFKNLNSSKKYLKFSFGEKTFTWGGITFSLGEIWFTLGDSRRFQGFWNFFFVAGGVLGLCGSGGPAGVSKVSKS